jgi:AraC-like DNA-binding protein
LTDRANGWVDDERSTVGWSSAEILRFQDVLEQSSAAAGAEHALLVTMMPGGDLRAIRAKRGSDAVARIFNRHGWRVDGPTWRAMIDGMPVVASEWQGSDTCSKAYDEEYLNPSHLQDVLSLPVRSPLFEGFPAAVVLPRSHTSTVSATDQARRVQPVIDRVSAPRPHAVSNWIVLNAAGEAVGQTGRALDVSPESLADLRKVAVALLTDERPTEPIHDRIYIGAPGIERVAWHVRIMSPLPCVRQAAVVFCRVPHWTQWARLVPEFFPGSPETALLLPAIAFMAEHYGRGPTLPEIAHSVHLSPFHFHRRFSELMGITPKNFLFDLQIDQARRFLVEGERELVEIARLCGFAHQSHFTSRFKHATGLTPTRWRRVHAARINPAGTSLVGRDA